jgi:hypothetical protein
MPPHSVNGSGHKPYSGNSPPSAIPTTFNFEPPISGFANPCSCFVSEAASDLGVSRTVSAAEMRSLVTVAQEHRHQGRYGGHP